MKALPIVPVEHELERLVLGWRLSHVACTAPACRCKRTPLAMKWGFYPATYGGVGHQLIAAACLAVTEVGEDVTADAYESTLRLAGNWRRCGGWRYYAMLLEANDDALAFEVERSAIRLIRLGQSRVALEQIVAIAEGHREADTAPLELVRHMVMQAGR